ncbi:transposase [Desulfovibrio inopinatus]|uniref:transposase n=1 Tax=Desulfovibrio inopinatus TaxID=102109 RepID=UPI00040F52B6|nr:transposase [Desulfovibrio inopinatus]
MARMIRLLVEDRPTIYHVMSRTALDGYPLGAVEKDYLLSSFKRFSALYFAEILGFCIMGNHFHLLVRMMPAEMIDDNEMDRRIRHAFGPDAVIAPALRERLRLKWSRLSEFMREIKQTFSRFYNARHHRRGYFWGDRFKSVIIEDGRTTIHCLAYIDLNPIRAGLVRRPEDYRWCSIGYHLQSNNADAFLSTDFGLEDDHRNTRDRLRLYRRFLYEHGQEASPKGPGISTRLVEESAKSGYEYSVTDRLRLRSRWFTDSGILGSQAFITELIQKFDCIKNRVKSPKEIDGLDFFALKRFNESQ